MNVSDSVFFPCLCIFLSTCFAFFLSFPFSFWPFSSVVFARRQHNNCAVDSVVFCEMQGRVFYGGRLETDKSVLERGPLPAPLRGAYLRFFHMRCPPRREETAAAAGASGGLGGPRLSFCNKGEALFVAQLVLLLHKTFQQQQQQKPQQVSLSLSDVGIISPYRAQAELILSLLKASPELRGATLPETDTVDAFQGREKAVIIVSFVRSGSPGQTHKQQQQQDAAAATAGAWGLADDGHQQLPLDIFAMQKSSTDEAAAQAPPEAAAGNNRRLGFVADERRLNVSLTRAKRALWLVGDALLLESSSLLRRLVSFVKSVPGACIDVVQQQEHHHNHRHEQNTEQQQEWTRKVITKGDIDSFFAFMRRHTIKANMQQNVQELRKRVKKQNMDAELSAVALPDSSNTSSSPRHSTLTAKHAAPLLEERSSKCSSKERQQTASADRHTASRIATEDPLVRKVKQQKQEEQLEKQQHRQVERQQHHSVQRQHERQQQPGRKDR